MSIVGYCICKSVVTSICSRLRPVEFTHTTSASFWCRAVPGTTFSAVSNDTYPRITFEWRSGSLYPASRS